MAKISRATMLEVSVTLKESQKWEWQVKGSSTLFMSGYEDNQTAAKFAGYNAMFMLLAVGWTP